MNEDKDPEIKPGKKIEIKDFAEEQNTEDQIDLKSDEHTLDDETIDEAIEAEQSDDNQSEVKVPEKDDENTELEAEEIYEDDGVGTADIEDEQKQDDENEAAPRSEADAATTVGESKEVKTPNGVENAENSDAHNSDNINVENPEEVSSEPEKKQIENLEDKELDEAVDDIVRSESDDVLVLDDAIKEPEEPQPSGLKRFVQKVKNGFSWWWNHTLIRNVSLAIFFLGLVAVGLIPSTRYAVLNTFGVRVQSSMRVIDNETRLPLENIRVTLQGVESKTDDNGEVRFDNLKLGSSDLVITRRGYAENRQNIVLGLGSNPLGDKTIVATGIQYTFELRDWISDAVINEATAISGEYTAKADEKGIIKLTLSEETEEDAEVTIKATGYREELVAVNDLALQDTNELLMVNDRKHLFVSNRDNRYDIFSVDLDGTHEELLLKATGKERDIPQLYPHPAQQIWALISSHEGETNTDGYVLDGLYVVDTRTDDIKRVARSERINIVGWSGDFLVYWQVVEGTSQGNPERSKLYSYNFVTGERVELAAANYFNDVELVFDEVYYAVSGFAVPESYARLFKINVDGEQKVQVLDKQVYSIFRTGLDDLLYSAANQEWFEHKLPGDPVETERRNSVPNNYTYVQSPSGDSVAWVRVRDGQGVLEYRTTLDDETSGDAEAVVDSGIREPLYWLGDKAIAYRVIKSGETADYLVSLGERPGDTEKITKITNITILTFNGY